MDFARRPLNALDPYAARVGIAATALQSCAVKTAGEFAQRIAAEKGIGGHSKFGFTGVDDLSTYDRPPVF